MMRIIAIAIAALFLGCGMEPSGKEKDYGQPPSQPEPDPWSDEIQGIVKEQCALSGCHAGASFLDNGSAFKASSSLRRIESGSMPLQSSPNYGLYNATKRRKLIDYLSGS